MPLSPADRCKNCGFNDTSMKFGVLVDYANILIFGYRAISNFAHNKNGRHFQDGRHRFIKFSDIAAQINFSGSECYSCYHKYCIDIFFNLFT